MANVVSRDDADNQHNTRRAAYAIRQPVNNLVSVRCGTSLGQPGTWALFDGAKRSLPEPELTLKYNPNSIPTWSSPKHAKPSQIANRRCDEPQNCLLTMPSLPHAPAALALPCVNEFVMLATRYRSDNVTIIANSWLTAGENARRGGLSSALDCKFSQMTANWKPITWLLCDWLQTQSVQTTTACGRYRMLPTKMKTKRKYTSAPDRQILHRQNCHGI